MGAPTSDNDVQDWHPIMIDSRDRLSGPAASTRPTMDNYGDLLALAGMVRASGTCVECGPGSPAHHAEHLWLVHREGSPDATPEGLLCSRHALTALAAGA